MFHFSVAFNMRFLQNSLSFLSGLQHIYQTRPEHLKSFVVAVDLNLENIERELGLRKRRKRLRQHCRSEHRSLRKCHHARRHRRLRPHPHRRRRPRRPKAVRRRRRPRRPHHPRITIRIWLRRTTTSLLSRPICRSTSFSIRMMIRTNQAFRAVMR